MQPKEKIAPVVVLAGNWAARPAQMQHAGEEIEELVAEVGKVECRLGVVGDDGEEHMQQTPPLLQVIVKWRRHSGERMFSGVNEIRRARSTSCSPKASIILVFLDQLIKKQIERANYSFHMKGSEKTLMRGTWLSSVP